MALLRALSYGDVAAAWHGRREPESRLRLKKSTPADWHARYSWESVRGLFLGARVTAACRRNISRRFGCCRFRCEEEEGRSWPSAVLQSEKGNG